MNTITLNPKQIEAVSHLDGPMVVLSVAGSGKTSVLIHRIINLIENHSIHPANLLAITFAKKAATEMVERLERKLIGQSKKIIVCTFHSFGYRILKNAGYPATQFKLIQNGEQMELFQKAMSKAEVLDDDLENLLHRVSKAKNNLLSPHHFALPGDHSTYEFSKVYQMYELLKRRQRLVDYDDLLCLPYRLLCHDQELLNHYQERFRYILIDELQDSSKINIELIKLLTGGHRNIWACGDDDQIIYEFRGAKPGIFVDFERHFNGSLKTVTMNQNYRSSKSIIKGANNLIGHNQVRVKKKMRTDNSEGEPIQVLVADNELAEAELIAEEISKLRSRKIKYGDMAILVRVHRLMPLIEATLIKKGISYVSRTVSIFKRREVKTVISVMRFLLNGEPSKGLDFERLQLLKSDLFPGIEEVSLKDAFDIGTCYVMMKSPEMDNDVEEQSLTKVYLEALEQLIVENESLSDFQKVVEQAVEDKGIPEKERVKILTIHQAKGLEFKAVIIPGVNEGILPHIKSLENVTSIEEERRLMYVAITRAMNHLIITYRKRHDGQFITPSRFIAEMKLKNP